MQRVLRFVSQISATQWIYESVAGTSVRDPLAQSHTHSDRPQLAAAIPNGSSCVTDTRIIPGNRVQWTGSREYHSLTLLLPPAHPHPRGFFCLSQDTLKPNSRTSLHIRLLAAAAGGRECWFVGSGGEEHGAASAQEQGQAGEPAQLLSQPLPPAPPSPDVRVHAFHSSHYKGWKQVKMKTQAEVVHPLQK